MCIFLGQKKKGIWVDFSEKFQGLCKNPDEVTRFDVCQTSTTLASYPYVILFACNPLSLFSLPVTHIFSILFAYNPG
jgi:hypothetical protein